MRRVDTPLVYKAADQWRDAALMADGSLFTPGEAIWTLATAEELFRHFNLSPDESSDSFDTKFKRQLQGSSPATYQLAAELVYVSNLIIVDTSGKSKRQ